jgi:hypothetical protein
VGLVVPISLEVLLLSALSFVQEQWMEPKVSVRLVNNKNITVPKTLWLMSTAYAKL